MDTDPSMVGLDASPIGCSSPLGVEWSFVARSGVVAAHIFVGPAKGRRCWGMWSISKFLHLFKVSDLREIVSIMAILTTKGTREVFLKIFVILPLAFVVIAPLGVLVPLILVAPNRLVLLGVVLVPSWSWIIVVSVFSFLFGIIQLMGHIFRIQLFKILILLNGRGLNKINLKMWLS